MTQPNYQTIAAREQAGVIHVTLQRPDVRNAMNGEMVDELRAVLSLAEQRRDVRALVLRGAGGNFSAGADLKDLSRAQSAAPPGHDPVSEWNAAFGRLCTAYACTEVPVVVALEGAVMGGGFGLACVADVVLAASSAVFRLPETSLGLLPAQIAPFMLARLGYSETKRLSVTGGKIDAQEALTIRLVHSVHDDLDAAVSSTLEKIRACAPEATRATKRLLMKAYTSQGEGIGALVDHAAELFAQAFRGPEAQEGIGAFLQKQKPSWAKGST
ncbi:MAG TPA: enoyl-CoA hydratase-related protein [Polyangiales bacterium]|nr:enoyl-CoA hydratase-related protein [Polyangiales bacterium]